MSFTIDERIAYIRGLDINKGPAAPSAAQGDESASVVGGSALSFLAGVNNQTKEDVMYSTCLAQVVADNKYPGRLRGQEQQWYDAYVDALQHLGWSIREFQITDIRDASAYRTVDHLVLVLAAARLTAGELAPFTKTIESLRDARNAGALGVFDKLAKNDDEAGFQLGVASHPESSKDAAVLKLGVYTYKAPHSIPASPPLLRIRGAQGRIPRRMLSPGCSPTAQLTLALDGDVYAQIREEVVRKLGDHIKEYIRAIHLI
ncbi:hypothetical protein ONZ51_g9432 [Trametes cubensis]|uniref:Uncharacterized protein n=1 Tax=Trametes cubensis TaxID=1111947 RepID=A0AAD7X7B0_9APHY|nr:hypothetical protein ONZ51_g9432 [Trametes cubensis]